MGHEGLEVNEVARSLLVGSSIHLPSIHPHNMADRGGYTTHVFVVDCSPSMGELVPDPQSLPGPSTSSSQQAPKPDGTRMVSKFDLAKEVIMRRLVSIVSSLKPTLDCVLI